MHVGGNVFPANFVGQDVCGLIVAKDNHQREQIIHRGSQTWIECIQDT